MKKIIALCVLSLLLGLLPGCSGGNAAGSSGQAQEAVESGGAGTSADASAENEGASQESSSPPVVVVEPDTVVLEKEKINTEVKGAEGVDVDLTVLNGNMIYSQVFQMMYSPEDFVGKVVRMKGNLSYFQDPNTGREYFACLIKDAAACCAQGIEFELAGDYVYPDDYPELGAELIVEGVFDTYVEGKAVYCTLRNAKLIEG